MTLAVLVAVFVCAGTAGVVVADNANGDGGRGVEADSDGGERVAAAGDGGTPAVGSCHDYFPMALGDRWVYKKTTTHPGEEPAVSETYSLVRGEYLFNGELWVHYEEDGLCFWVHNRDDGQYEADVGYDEETAGLQIEREFLLFRMPVKQGESWPFLADFTSEAPPGTLRCLAVDKAVKTPAGEFSCVVYELDDQDTKATYHIARGRGMVANEWTIKETGETIKLELKRFLPGKVRRGPRDEPPAVDVASPAKRAQ